MNKTFKKALMLAILAVIAIALFDVLAAKSGVFGTAEDYTQGNFSPGWWPLFFKFNLILMLVIPVSYYFFGRKDKSEAVALFLTSIVLWFAGLADVFYFILQGQWVPSTLPWLEGSLVTGGLSTLFGFETVTRTALFISVIIGFIAIYLIDRFLERI